MLVFWLLPLFVFAPFATATTVPDIQGDTFVSPYAGKRVDRVCGIVTATSDDHLWLSALPEGDDAFSSGLCLNASSGDILSTVDVGDSIAVSGTVRSYRARDAPNDLYVTELQDLSDVTVHSSSDATVDPVILEQDYSPPTDQLSVLDIGPDGFLSVPNNVSLVDDSHANLKPDVYGLDFWYSLSGVLVTIPSPISVDFNNKDGNLWVHGNWDVVGENSRGGLTMIRDSNGVPTPHPDEILIGEPLDGSSNPVVAVGTQLSNITGVVHYIDGYFTVLPLTAPSIKTKLSTPPSASTIWSSDDPCTITVAHYNVDNMGPNSPNMAPVAIHIVQHLNSPDLIFLQEIEDDSGDADDGTVDANFTLSNMVAAITNAGSPVKYAFTDINPIDNQDGGKKGVNIRQAYLYNPNKISLVRDSLRGSPIGGTLVIKEHDRLTLSYNPGRINPGNPAWKHSRKPLAAAWETTTGSYFFTVNVHLTSKLGSSSLWGNARPPVNKNVEKRTEQVKIVSTFVENILKHDANASIIVGGDFNEFTLTTSVFESLSSTLKEADDVAGIPPEERYTYLYQGISQKLDHLFVSTAVAGRGLEVEHVHVNTWADSSYTMASDHDPTVVLLKVC
ncbi:DNase I-like protein [Scleroderma citrinum]